jgi:ABC-type glycerol-3-phosphate transport system permease component
MAQIQSAQMRRERSPSLSRTNRRVHLAAMVVLNLLVLFVIFPYYWMLNTALRRTEDLFTTELRWLPIPATLANFQRALADEDFIRAYMNSLITSGGTAIAVTLLCTLAAYGLARFVFVGRKPLITALVVSQMLPAVLLIIPLFVVFSKLGLAGTYLGLIIGYATFTLPFATLMLRAFFGSFPIELEEAAMIDGCTRMQAFWKITFPLSLPGIVAVCMFGFVLAWNDFLFSLILSRDIKTTPVAVYLHNLSTTQYASDWSLIIADAVLMTIPVVILFFFLQHYIVDGIRSGAVKG